jgi:hypothetical protein
MKIAAPCTNLAVCLALLPAGLVLTPNVLGQISEARPVSATRPVPETTTPAPIANVYVQTEAGVNVYNANASGALTLVKGSPFYDDGQMEGNNGGYLLVVGTDYLHSYKIESNGAVGAQAAEIDTQSYGGAQCGNTSGAGSILDHSGHYFYVQLFGASYDGGEDFTCSDWQSYKVANDGTFTFLGDSLFEQYGSWPAWQSADPSSVPTISSNDDFAYAVYYDGGLSDFASFPIGPGGVLGVNTGVGYNTPTPNPLPPDSDNNYFPASVTADPSGHLAVAMTENAYQGFPAPQLASYTLDKSANLTTTNSYENMPKLWSYGTYSLRMSPAGNLLAVSAAPAGDNGLEIFHFNGAAPITPYSSMLLPATTIDQMAWDNNNHLYALSYKSSELYVFTVTPTTISQTAGSPYKISRPYGLKGLIVVPK